MGTGSGAAAALALVAFVSFLLLVLQPTTTLAQFSWPGQGGPPGSPFNGPPFYNICNNHSCGKGNCSYSSASTNSSYSYSYSYNYSYSSNDSLGCQCQDGWSKYSHDGQHQYLPCVIPKCNFSRSCSQSFMSQKPKDLPKFPFDSNMTIDPCSWAICGEGTCKNTSAFSYICECKSGYENIFNISNLPCFRDCEGGTGKSCEALGIGKLSTRGGVTGSNKGGAVTTAPASLAGSLLIMMASLLALA